MNITLLRAGRREDGVAGAASGPLAIDLEKFRSKGVCASGEVRSLANLAPFLELLRRHGYRRYRGIVSHARAASPGSQAHLFDPTAPF
jgi:hypothetical protein